ncbi:MAG TPA: hypothetical protein VM432_00060 [Bdellovibrionales bacterium]|nr:hypothetical protein [Bdellovibrionales bacterium]
MKRSILAGMVLLIAHGSFAADALIAKDDKSRIEIIRRGKVWEKPEWVTETASGYEFSSKLDVLKGSPVKGNSLLLEKDDVYCQLTDKDLEKGNGKTPKFKCRLMQMNAKTGKPELVLDEKGKTDDIKIKYTVPGTVKYNPEVFAEVVGTRLLWALGFGADRMFGVKRVHCYGCTSDPFNNLVIDPETLVNPMVFTAAAIEKKAKGTEIVAMNAAEGWEFSEAMANYPADASEGHYQFKYRDSLRLLMSVLQHTDNKAENQRMLCLDKPAPATAELCSSVQLIVQDIGTSLGVGLTGLKINKFDYPKWSQKPVWKDAASCKPNYGTSLDSSVARAVSEYGRDHLAKLLAGFIKGDAGRKRVEDLFRAANVEMRNDESGNVQLWADAFIAKAKQVIAPAGEANSAFKCKM